MDLYYASQSFYPHIGGVSTALLNLTREMVNKGNRVVEVHLRPSGEENWGEFYGVEVHRVPREPINKEIMLGYSRFKESIYQESHFPSDRFTRAAEGVEGFSEFNRVNQYFGEELRELLKNNPADIIHINDFQLLLTYQYIPRGMPLILSWHIPFIEKMSPSLRSFLVKYLNEYDAVVFSAESYGKAALRAGVSPQKIEIIPPLANTNLFKVMEVNPATVRRRYGLPQTKKLIFCVQRVDAKAGHRQLIEALPKLLKKVPGAALVFAGGHSMSSQLSDERNRLEQEVKNLVQEKGLSDRVFFLGNIPYEKLPALYNSVDVVALCSKNEGFGLSLTEAMACGKPVIGTDAEGIRTQIMDGKNGFLVPVGDPEATADRIVKILRSDSLARRMGKNALQVVHEKFRLERGIEKHLMLYNKVQRSKKMMYRIEYLEGARLQAIITDLDRTIIDKPDTPEFNARNYDPELLRALSQLGIDLFLATGRNFDYVKKLCQHFHYWRCVVAENGAVIYFPRTQKTITITTPEMSQAKKIIKAMKLPGTTVGKVITSSRLEDEIRIKTKLWKIAKELSFIRNVNEVMVTPKGVDKGQGLRLAMQYLHIHMDRTLVVGDGENDVDMFLNPGFKIALSNADLKLKKLANQVLRKPATQGIWDIVRKLQKSLG